MDALKPQRNEPNRMEKLAKLPVFWGLEGKRVVLAGGSDGAAWKAELLLACGAELHLYCEESELSDCFAALVSTSQMLTWHDRSWGPDSFKGAELALADCETDEEAGRFYNAARSVSVPVNVIDKPEFCQFQFGSIVNRSPVVVSISTDGAAPILAQAIQPAHRDFAAARSQGLGRACPDHPRAGQYTPRARPGAAFILGEICRPGVYRKAG